MKAPAFNRLWVSLPFRTSDVEAWGAQGTDALVGFRVPILGLRVQVSGVLGSGIGVYS